MFGLTKTSQPRTIPLGRKTVEPLRRHKAAQAEIQLANRHYYQDYGLVFARTWDTVRGGHTLGRPMGLTHVAGAPFRRLIRAASVRVIVFHGLRHTCATLLLKAGVPAHVVQERLGHRRVEMTLGIYAHALPDMQQDAAAKLAALLQL